MSQEQLWGGGGGRDKKFLMKSKKVDKVEETKQKQEKDGVEASRPKRDVLKQIGEEEIKARIKK